MKKIKSALFSMLTTSCLVVVFAVAIAYATFIENDYGTITAKVLIYNSWWFNTLLAITGINLIGSLLYYKALQLRRWSMVLFHLAFLIILVGAAITRFYSYEGRIHIREGKSSNQLITTDNYIQIKASSNGLVVQEEEQVLFSPYTNNRFSESVKLAEKDVAFKMLDYVPSAVEDIVADEGGRPLLSFILVKHNMQRRDFILEYQEDIAFNDLSISFEGQNENATLKIQQSADTLDAIAADTVKLVSMMGRTDRVIAPGQVFSLKANSMYQVGDYIFALKSYFPFARKVLSTATGGAASMAQDAILIQANVGEKQKQLVVYHNNGDNNRITEATIDSIDIAVGFGSKVVELPFEIYLNDFELERYPGSMSPSSYASDVTLIDEARDVEMPYRIYMNNILDYGGFRFFQSSYDTDEKGTILSVSHDFLGTAVTYFGYFLMSLGMIFTFFNKKSRFHALLRSSSRLKELKKKSIAGIVIAFCSLLPAITNAQTIQPAQIDQEHVKKFETLLVQDHQGRIEPVNTLASEVLRKLNRKSSFEGMSASEVFLGMSARPASWRNVQIIRIANSELQRQLGFRNKYVSFNQMIDMNTGVYKLQKLVDETYKKQPTQRNKFDKEVINVDERMNICFQIFQGDFLKVFPVIKDENNKWVSEKEFYALPAHENDSIHLLTNYFRAVNQAITSGDYQSADQKLEVLNNFQQTHGSEIIPGNAKIRLEILYNKFNIFTLLSRIAGVIGFVLLIIHLLGIFNEKLKLKRILTLGTILVAILFIAYSGGLAVRWYISGHAPWSNGYETLLYVGWATMLTGFVFLKKSQITLTVTTILSSLILMVAGLSWMNPEITNLVPVLKSYWLIVHVAVITASYGFLGVAALLGFLNLIIMMFRNPKNLKSVSFTIIELAIIIELALIVGLILLTIGAFIGGVWANESWGRYWGWDPKETWALVTILVYSFIIHLRKVPGMYNHFVLSAMSLAGFSSVLMTFFGVNYYLSGMHSYAQGEAPPVPNFVYIAIAVVVIAIILAARSENKYGGAEKIVKLEAKH